MRVVLLAALCLGLAACASFPFDQDAPVGPPATESLLGKIAEIGGLAQDPPKEAPDFIKDSRPDPHVEYYEPVVAKKFEHPTPLETPESLNALQTRLEAQRARHDKLSGREPYKPKPKVKEQQKPAHAQANGAPSPANGGILGNMPLFGAFGANATHAASAPANTKPPVESESAPEP